MTPAAVARPRVLSLVELDADELARLEAVAEVKVRPWTETLVLADPGELSEELTARQAMALFVEADFVVAETFAAAPGLRFVGICRGDSGHVDIAAATRAGVAVTHAPGRNAEAVAELTIAMMLAVLRGIPNASAYVQERRWQDPVTAYVGMRGSELGRQVVGIIGLGRIGRQTARLAGAFGARVLATEPALSDEQIRAAGCVPVGLRDLLTASTMLAVHCPSLESTRGLIDAEALSLMPRGAWLVVTTGEGVVVEGAVAEALRRGHLSGAAFDVFETNPIRPDNPLLDAPNALLLPHIGGATDATVQRYSAMVVDDYLAFLAGRRPERIVNPKVLERRG
ncbi:MAG: hydroxyacid dehydrogenase [Chloroflexi bacterium]|nr:hydroxyacid dehydrogenase [Chloroflexota bacterium]